MFQRFQRREIIYNTYNDCPEAGHPVSLVVRLEGITDHPGSRERFNVLDYTCPHYAAHGCWLRGADGTNCPVVKCVLDTVS